jgi:predicted Zn-dependent protease with MMP-like domain
MADAMFDELVREALDALPDWVQPYLEQISVLVEDRSPPDLGELYGLYQGVPVGHDQTGLPPPTITLYRETLERDFGRGARLAEQVRVTVAHEVAHHFGIDDDRLRTLGYG